MFVVIFKALIGVVFFGVGLSISDTQLNTTALINATFEQQASIYTDYYLAKFSDSFDNEITPYYALIICLWGAFFCEVK